MAYSYNRTASRVNPEVWVHHGGGYKTKDGLGSISKVGPNDWCGFVGTPGKGRIVVRGMHTAAAAAVHVERALADADFMAHVDDTPNRTADHQDGLDLNVSRSSSR